MLLYLVSAIGYKAELSAEDKNGLYSLSCRSWRIPSPTGGGSGQSDRGEHRAGDHHSGGVLVTGAESFAFSHDAMQKRLGPRAGLVEMLVWV